MNTTASDDRVDAIRVLIADDHPVVRDGLAAMLEGDEVHITAMVATGSEAVEAASSLDIDVVLMDVRMPGMDGLVATRLIKEAKPGVAVIVLTSFENRDYLREAIEAGAAGYLLKGAPSDLLIESIRLVRAGASIFDPALLSGLLREIADRSNAVPPETLNSLSEREREVLILVARGQTNHEIGEQLGYSTGTVKATVERVIQKLEVSDRTQAAVLAVRAGLQV